jgi:hypothetical protein
LIPINIEDKNEETKNWKEIVQKRIESKTRIISKVILISAFILQLMPFKMKDIFEEYSK